VGAIALTAARAGAQTMDLTLEDAVKRAVANNPDLAVVRLGIAVETERVNESKGAFTPMFSTVFGRSSVVTPPSTSLLGSQGVDVDDWFGSTGVRQRLRWGSGIWSASWDFARTSTNNPISSFDPSMQSGLQLAFSQPLLRDRKIDASRHQYTIAKRNQSTADLRFQEAVVQTVAAVKQAYWTFKATLANVTVQQQSLQLAEQLARENKIKVDAGQIPPLDLVQAEAEVAGRRENLIRARTLSEDAEDALRRLIIDPADTSFWQVRLQPVEEPTRLADLPDVNAAVAKALAGRFDLARAAQELENAKSTVEFLDNQRLPDVRLETSYRGSGLGGTEFLRSGGFPGSIIGTRNRGVGDALGQAFTGDYPAWSLGVSVSYPIGRSYEASSMARAEVERQQVTQRIASTGQTSTGAIVVGVLLVFIVYPLSIGPAIWLTARGYLRTSAVQSFYMLVLVSVEQAEPLENVVTWWGSLGVPDGKAVNMIFDTDDASHVFQFTRTGEAIPSVE
jgi:outer membrane protein TolC